MCSNSGVRLSNHGKVTVSAGRRGHGRYHAPPGIPKGGYASWAHGSFHVPDSGSGLLPQGWSWQCHVYPAGGSTCRVGVIAREQVAQAVAAVTDIPSMRSALPVRTPSSGPGQFIESNFYNDFHLQQTGIRSSAVCVSERAPHCCRPAGLRDRRPGRIATGKREITGFSRNRSWVPPPQQPQCRNTA